MRNMHGQIGVLGVVLFLFGHGVALAGGDKAPVRVGEWTITPRTFETYDGVVWTGTAKGPGETSVGVRISSGSNGRIPLVGAKEMEELKVPGVGDVQFLVVTLHSMAQVDRSLAPPPVQQRIFIHERDGVKIVLTPRHEQPTPARMGFDWGLLPGAKARPRPQAKPQKEVPKVLDDPALGLLRAMLAKREVLGRYAVAKGYPELEARIDQGEFRELKRSGVFKNRADYGWSLSARPGQEVSFRLRVQSLAQTVTTQGMEELPKPTAKGLLAGTEFSVGGRKSTIGKDGVGTVTYCKIGGPEMLTLRLRGWQALGRAFRANILLRWGRPEETWLDGNHFPLAPRPATLDRGSMIQCILQDLAAAYDPDRETWVNVRGSTNREDQPGWPDGTALKGLDLSAHPRLADIPSQIPVRQWLRQTFWGLPAGKQTAKELAGWVIAKSSESNRLWQPRSGYQGKPSGWHSPATAHVLAVLWQQYPDLRESNPLERVLDYWAEAIAAGSPLVGGYGKGGAEIVRKLAPKGQAVAALHLGHRLLGKEAYAKARAAVLLSMQEDRQHGRAIYQAMSGGQGWCDNPGWARDDRNWRGICTFVSIYGQTCAFIGNHPELEKAQAWIAAVLGREGKERENAFRSYSAASFSERSGMLAVLRGKAAYLATPFHQR